MMELHVMDLHLILKNSVFVIHLQPTNLQKIYFGEQNNETAAGTFFLSPYKLSYPQTPCMAQTDFALRSNIQNIQQLLL